MIPNFSKCSNCSQNISKHFFARLSLPCGRVSRENLKGRSSECSRVTTKRRKMRTRRSSHPPTCASGGLVLLELSPLVVHLIRLRFLFLLLVNLSIFGSSPSVPSSCSFSSSSSWNLFLVGPFHFEINGEAYEFTMLLRQILLSAFLQELGSVLLPTPNHFRSSVDPTMDNLSVFCSK